ncbi:MAG: amidohydrolase [Deltaproteobacteria bacterium]|nr:amidohydrolase [Deltaproteobacteria bacterium]
MNNLDILIQNGTVLTMDDGDSIIQDGLIGIKGGKIEYSGKLPVGDFEAKIKIDARGGLILPGLINGHTHAAMTLFRGLADDLPLMEWLNNYIFPVEAKMDAEFVFTGSLLACAEMILSGTTTFCDMYLFEDEVAKAAKSSGMRCIVGEVLYDFDSPNYGSTENGLIYTESLIDRWKDDSLVSIAVEPHSPFTCSPSLLSAANDLALKYKAPLITHLAETETEINVVRERYGRRPVGHLDSLGILGPHLIADHCVHLNDAEIDLFAEKGVKVVHNPESNMKLASGIAPIPAMLQRGLTVGIGTDGCASNNNLDLFGEMDTAAKLHKIGSMDTTVMDALTVVRMATIEGAKALGIDDTVGSIEEGKKADIIVVDCNKPHLTPMYNPFSHLVYAARGEDVAYSIIDGRLVMDRRRLLVMDVDAVISEARRRAKDILEWLPSASFKSK